LYGLSAFGKRPEKGKLLPETREKTEKYARLTRVFARAASYFNRNNALYIISHCVYKKQEKLTAK